MYGKMFLIILTDTDTTLSLCAKREYIYNLCTISQTHLGKKFCRGL